MNNEQIISKMNSALHQTTIHMSMWLNRMLRQISNEWWQECVLDKLSYNQRMIATEKNITKLEEFDLAALLRIADRNWYAMRDFAYLPTSERECLRNMMAVRNNWAHCSGALPQKELIQKDIQTIIEFLEQRNGPHNIIADLMLLAENLDELEDNVSCATRRCSIMPRIKRYQKSKETTVSPGMISEMRSFCYVRKEDGYEIAT